MPGTVLIGNGIGYEAEIACFLILAGLLVFGIYFDHIVDKLGNKQEGFTSLLVVIGVFVTIIGAGLLNVFIWWNSFFIDLIAFAASGTPMIVGSIVRYMVERERVRKALHDTQKTLAK